MFEIIAYLYWQTEQIPFMQNNVKWFPHDSKKPEADMGTKKEVLENTQTTF